MDTHSLLDADPTSDDDGEREREDGLAPDPPEPDEWEAARRQRATTMRAFLRSDRVVLHPSASCEMRDFFGEFNAYCRDSGLRPFKTSWKDPWNEFGIHMARRRGTKRLLGIQLTPSPAAQAITDSQPLAFVRASLGQASHEPGKKECGSSFPWTNIE